MNIEIPLLKAQRQFIKSKAPFPAISGGLGSGKTEAGVLRHVSLMLSDVGINMLIGMPTYDLLKLRAMPCTEEVLAKLGLAFTVNKSDFAILVHGYGTIFFRSYDRPERWVSFEVAHTLLDELDTLPIDKAEVVWRKSSERTRQKCKGINTIAAVTSPDQGINGFIGTKWGGNENTALEDGYELIFADTRDNHYLPDGYVDQIMQNYDSLLAEIYISGRLVSLNRDKVYHYFERARHHIDRFICDKDKVLHIGVDFNIGGCCAVVYVIDAGEPVAVDEFVSYDTQDFVSNVADRYEGKRIVCYPDASGKNNTTNASASDVAIIKHAGIQCDIANKNPFVRDRVNSVNAKLSNNTFKINTDTCQNLTLALESQGYDNSGEPEKFKTHPAMDDWIDGMGYFMHRRYAIKRPTSRIIAR